MKDVRKCLGTALVPPREPSDLGRRLANCLDIARRSIPILAVAPSGQGAVRHSFRSEKFICETALLLYAASSVAQQSPDLQPSIRAVALELEPHARSEVLLTAMRLRPVIAAELSVAHVCLTRIGYPDSHFQSELDLVLGASVVGMLERLPWKDLESDWLARIGGPRLGVDAEHALGRAALTTGLDALSARRDEIYAFTHGLIYATDFGQSPRPLPRDTVELLDDAEIALARCLDDDDFDLAGEVLLSWPYLRARWTPAAAFAMSVLTRVEDEVGFLPSLSLRERSFSRLEGADRTHHVVSEAYHTAYVMGLLSAASLLPGCAPPSAVPVDAHSGGSRALCGLLLPRTPTPQWEVDFASLSNSQQDCLGPFLATVGLRRAVMQFDYRRLRSILEKILEHRLPISHAVQQGAELLRRLGRADTLASA
jgi:hypothetical protein